MPQTETPVNNNWYEGLNKTQYFVEKTVDEGCETPHLAVTKQWIACGKSVENRALIVSRKFSNQCP